jgi:hypothetical protein
MQIAKLAPRTHGCGRASIGRGALPVLPRAPRLRCRTPRAVRSEQLSNAERFVADLELQKGALDESEDSVVVGSIDELRGRLAGLQAEVRCARCCCGDVWRRRARAGSLALACALRHTCPGRA